MKPVYFACRDCGKKKKRVRAEKRVETQAWVYRDEKGSQWAGHVCPRCRINSIQDARLGFKKNMSGAKMVGNKSEVVVKQFFEGLGFLVKHNLYNGPDLVVKRRGGPEIRVEVKTVSGKGGYFQVSRLSRRSRKQDNLIVFVKGKDICIVRMRDYAPLIKEGCAFFIPKQFSLSDNGTIKKIGAFAYGAKYER